MEAFGIIAAIFGGACLLGWIVKESILGKWDSTITSELSNPASALSFIDNWLRKEFDVATDARKNLLRTLVFSSRGQTEDEKAERMRPWMAFTMTAWEVKGLPVDAFENAPAILLATAYVVGNKDMIEWILQDPVKFASINAEARKEAKATVAAMKEAE